MPEGEPVSFEKQLARVERIRKLRAKREVRGLLLDTDALLGHVQRSFELELPPQALSGSEDALVGLGVVPIDFDYEKTMLSLLSTQLAGLYDPRLEAMFVHRDLEGDDREAALLHELVHALQDQHYHLDEITRWQLDGTDRSSALGALAEGDATSAMFDGMLEGSGRTALEVPETLITAQMADSIRAEEGDPIPPIIRRSLIAPYSDGLVFVHALRRKNGWESVDAAWKNPPTSTEQVLHFEKYLAAEKPLPVPPLNAPPGPTTYERLMTDVWGEQSVRLMFEEWMPGADASEAAMGWGGDRIAVYRADGNRAVTWHLVADDEERAEKHFASFLRAIPKAKVNQDRLGEREFAWACSERAEQGPFLVARWSRHVALLIGPFNRDPDSAPLSDCAQAATWWQTELSQLDPAL